MRIRMEDRMGSWLMLTSETLAQGFSISRAQVRKAAGVFDDGYRRLVASAATVGAGGEKIQ